MVQQEFEDPYHPNLPGYELTTYPHEHDAARIFCVFSVFLKGTSVPPSKATPGFEARAWGAAAGGQQANNP